MLCALCAIVPMLAQGFSGSGSGTSDDPYRIFNADQLNQVRNFLGKTDVFFSLEADIDLAPWLAENNPYEGWQPIGTESSPFQGAFNGNGHTISNLTINRPETDNVGLFGYCQNGATIRKVILSNCSVIGKNYVGSIIGCVKAKFMGSSASEILITNESFGAVSGVAYVGGVCGYALCDDPTTLTFSECNVYATITGNNCIGGIIGDGYGDYRNPINISSASFGGILNGNNNVGGIIGLCEHYASIDECMTFATINGEKYVGGIAGFLDRGAGVIEINNCLVTSELIIGKSDVGGICGFGDDGTSTITKCYTNIRRIIGNADIYGIGANDSPYVKSCVAINGILTANSSTMNASINRIGPSPNNGTNGTSNENKAWVLTKMLLNDEEQKPVEGLADGTNIGLSALKLKATYQGLGWDFDNVWEIQETETFPYFKTQTAPPYFTGTLKAGQTEISGQCVEDGTVTIRIGDKEYSAQSSGNTWTVTVDPLQGGETAEITVRADGKMPSYPVFADIELTGNGTAEAPFLVASAADLRGVTEDAAYYKLTQDIDLTEWIDENNPTGGWQPVGDDIYGVNIAELDGDGHKITGLWIDNSDLENVGLFSRFKGEIKDLYVEISSGKAVSGTSNIGAIAGTLRGSVTNCSVKGSLTEGKYVGSIAGMSTGSIAQCYAEGTITNATASAYVGGLVGKTSGTVSDSYDDVTINASGKSNYSGGIAGYNTGTVSHCYATGNIVGDRIGGVVGYNAESTSRSSSHLVGC